MKLKSLLLTLVLAVSCLAAMAQQGGVRGKVISRVGRDALSNVNVTVEGTGQSVQTDAEGNFLFENLPSGNYTLKFTAPDFEELDVMVRVDKNIRDMASVVVSPGVMQGTPDDSVFAELDTDSGSSDEQSLPSSLASGDLFNEIASYRFSEMRFNTRGYDSPYVGIHLNGVRFNDAMTGYGPWSLWSGLNDATRNQEGVSGLSTAAWGVGGIGGMTNINARASQVRKGFRVSVSNANQMYRFRVLLTYGSGQLDNGWSYAMQVATRQGGNGYVDGIYYNSYAYFASVEKLFGSNDNHRLGFTILASPTERGAQQASTDEAYDLFGSHYYNPNVGMWAGKLRNSRVRKMHEPIAMFTYTWDISERTRLNATTSLRFGKNAYSALTWNNVDDPRGDYYRKLPSYREDRMTGDIKGDLLNIGSQADLEKGFRETQGRIMFDHLYERNSDPGRIEEDILELVNKDGVTLLGDDEKRSQTALEDRYTNQLDYNFVANVSHQMQNNMRITGGVNLRVNRTSYFDKIKDLIGGDYWYDTDKFAERDMPSVMVAQNDLEYYLANGHARIAREGDKFNYNYRAHMMETKGWALFDWSKGGFSMSVGGEAGYSTMHREGMWQKGLFPTNSKGNSDKLDYLIYNAKANFSYRLSAAHTFNAGVMYAQNAPKFASAFVSARTRNDVTPGLSAEKIFGAELGYNLNYPFIKARVSGYYTTFADQSKVISFYDDTRNNFTNFAMSGIDKRHYGVEAALNVPIWNGIALQGAVSWGDYTYTSNANFVQTVDNRNAVVSEDTVNWKGLHVESSPQFAANIGIDYTGPNNWFAEFNFNYYDKLYISMNPFYRTAAAIQPYLKVIQEGAGTIDDVKHAVESIKTIGEQDDVSDYYTLGLSVGKFWYIKQYMLGFNIEVKNLLNNQNIKTGGYEQMRINKINQDAAAIPPREFSRFDSKYFYMLGTTYFLNVYLRF